MQTGRYSAVAAAVLLSGSKAAQTEPSGAFRNWFLHVSAAGSVYHLDDEGSPYRFSLGAGRPIISDRISLMADAVFSYYEVNHTADQNPQPGITGGESTALGFDLLLRIECLSTSLLNIYIEGGPGILISTGARSRVMISLQWFHLSNAWVFERNSGYDGIQRVVGPEWSL